MGSLMQVLMLTICVGIATTVVGLPQQQSNNRVGLDRPSTETPPQVSECGLDAVLDEVFGNSGNSDCGNKPPQPNNNGGFPPNNNGGFPPNNNGGFPPNNNGGFPPNNNGGFPPNNNGGFPPNNGDPQQPDGREGDCTCVQYYLCNDNNTINEDGVGVIDIRLKDEECDNYLLKCCGGENIRPTRDPVTPRPQPPNNRNTCGNRNFDGIGFRITGNNDNEAQYGEFPWMVAVIRPDQTLSQPGKAVNVYQCGGSLIHPQVVLTGAHCVSGKDNLVVRAGEWDTQTKNELYPTQDRRVRQVIVHEGFNSGSLANDPALLVLDSPVDMNQENVGLICLPEQNENMDNRDCVASGWGKDLFGKEGKYQVILKRVDVPTVPRGQCLEALRRTRLGQRFKLHESFLCAGGIPGKDTCKGDGGGPLVCPSRDNPQVYQQAGIIAWGIDCGTETPGVYVNVPFFVNWIQNKLQEQGFSL